ncbi:hypothetical protein LINPERHAP1_LOCUS15409, partial [Linum perenne]
MEPHRENNDFQLHHYQSTRVPSFCPLMEEILGKLEDDTHTPPSGCNSLSYNQKNPSSSACVNDRDIYSPENLESLFPITHLGRHKSALESMLWGQGGLNLHLDTMLH